MSTSGRRQVTQGWAFGTNGKLISIMQSLGSTTAAPPGALIPIVSVIIPAYGQPELVRHAVSSVRRAVQWNCAEVIVVDDASPEPIQVEGVRLLRNEKNLGFGQSADRGASVAKGAFLLFLNSDAAVRPGCIEELLEQAHRGYDVVGARLVNPDGSLQAAGMYWDDEHKSHRTDTEGKPLPFVRREAVTGACMLVRASTFRKIGGFGADYGRGYFEDVDLCLRVREAGGQVAYAADAVAEHRSSASFGKDAPAHVRAGHAVFLRKWIETGRFPVGAARVAKANQPKERTFVSVVVPVHNALAQTKACLEAAADDPGYENVQWIVVDDASDEPTHRMLAEWVSESPTERALCTLGQNWGYLGALLTGIQSAQGQWICSLNSDTVPTRGWLGKMMRAALSDERIAVVNPLSNGAANLSVAIPRGQDLTGAGRAAASASLGEPIDVVYPVGFCFLVRRKAWDELGGFDSAAFPKGYGEETDFCERAIQKGWRCVLEPSAYVYHQGKASHGLAKGQEMEKAGLQTFFGRHGDKARGRLAAFDASRAMNQLRHTINAAVPHDDRPGVAFYAHALDLCGGVLACYHLARRLSENHGWRATLVTKNIRDHSLMEAVGHLQPLVYSSDASITASYPMDRSSPRGGVLVATAWHTAETVARTAQISGGAVIPAYFIQDDEAKFMLPDGTPYVGMTPEKVAASYGLIPNRVTNSHWVQEHVRSLGHDSTMIPVGVDTDLFYPREQYKDRFTVIAMCRHTTPRRGYALLVRVYRELRKVIPTARLLVYGMRPKAQDAAFLEPLGTLPQHRLAEEMAKAHCLLEPSEFQGAGLPSLEAMASGLAVVTRDNLGIRTYGQDGRDCLIREGRDFVAAVKQLHDDTALRERLGKGGRETAMRFSWNAAASAWNDWLRKVVR